MSLVELQTMNLLKNLVYPETPKNCTFCFVGMGSGLEKLHCIYLPHWYFSDQVRPSLTFYVIDSWSYNCQKKGILWVLPHLWQLIKMVGLFYCSSMQTAGKQKCVLYYVQCDFFPNIVKHFFEFLENCEVFSEKINLWVC